MNPNHLEGLLRQKFPGPDSQNFRFSRTKVGARVCISNSFPGDIDTKGATLENSARRCWCRGVREGGKRKEEEGGKLDLAPRSFSFGLL